MRTTPLNPSDLKMLDRVFAACRDDLPTDERERLASRIIAGFQSGITEERELIEASRWVTPGS